MTSISEEVEFYGHPLVQALHPTTIEVTREDYLTRRGDCIIGIRANKAPSDLSPRLRELIRTDGTRIRFVVEDSQGHSFAVLARGDARLTLTSTKDMVIRKSDFVSERTIALGASDAAVDLPREIIDNLKNHDRKGRLIIEVEI